MDKEFGVPKSSFVTDYTANILFKEIHTQLISSTIIYFKLNL